MNRLDGKRALITGGTTGIGLETAKQFLAEGARLIVTGSNPENLKKAQAELGDQVTVVAAEATDMDAQRRLARTVADTFGQLDVVFLNAGISIWQPFEDWDEQTFDRQLTINFKSPFFLLQALLPHLASPASVIVTGSNSAHGGFDRANAYAATKAALASLAPSLSRELTGRGVRVNTVSPGVIDTPLYSKLGIPAEYYDSAMEGIRAGIPAGRFGTAREIAAAVVYLASDDSAFALGSDFVVDGGATL
ncbi:SDR family oxidoreductase [Actinacidiphila acididurans]|uniref:SDR family oxidoreductase n=1 Tax=Actinacidiphila acididurans TaxID=2784346 RepID=A0ABS2TTK7_9ACTN|nr:SDR family oxidoreductase [Actinacidiphila acididurans]MBM9506152.1 SDR family oxidoreductase [Actinacidiphila acididurans]